MTQNLINSKQVNCQPIEEVLRHLCKTPQVYDWVLKWIAYPLQNQGVKMQTAIVMHGREGTGKSLFWRDVVGRIYGQSAVTVDHNQFDSAFNAWLSQRLFVVVEGVLPLAELAANPRLKQWVSGRDILIDSKNVSTQSEKNQVNFVFLSDQVQANSLETCGRRYCIIYTPPALNKAFYDELGQCMQAGGVESFYHMLLNLDLAGFNEHTEPPQTSGDDALAPQQ